MHLEYMTDSLVGAVYRCLRKFHVLERLLLWILSDEFESSKQEMSVFSPSFSLELILSLDGQSLSRFIMYMTEVSFMWSCPCL